MLFAKAPDIFGIHPNFFDVRDVGKNSECNSTVWSG
jgi:hypothetical protein